MRAAVIRDIGSKTVRHESGFTLVELLVSAAMAVVVVAGLHGVITSMLESGAALREQNDLTLQAEFALSRMVRATSHSRRLLLPLADNPATNWPEHIREETLPPSPPIGDSTLATAVLAVTLPAYVDLDFNGVPDADDDADGRIDEDLPNDNHHDFFPGIMLIDDDGDGSVDEGTGWAEDDEDGTENEDPLDGLDNDGDGSIDEDPPTDNNGDGCAGICGVDDNSNGTVDGSGSDDDDEDGGGFDDAYDPVVFYLDNGTLLERMPVPWNEDGISTPDGPVDGRDFVASPIAENVSRFRVERLNSAAASQLIDITLELTGASGQTVSLNRRIRVGGAL